jgi:hypothetical protein
MLKLRADEKGAQSVNRYVCPEGWAIFWTSDDELQIQMDDDAQDFASDEEALAHVKRLAREGSAIHQLALQIVEG